MRFFSITIILFLAFTSCIHRQHASTVGKSKNEINNTITDSALINLTTEKALGEALFINILRKQKMLEVSDEFKNYTSDITKKLGENSNRPELIYETYFIDSKEFIAMGLPGGKILISKDFLNLIKSESEYANLIANQMAKIAKQHLLHNLLKDSEYAAVLKSGSVTERVLQQGCFILLDMGFEVNMVNEADRLAPTYAMHLGYDVHGLQNFLESVHFAMEKNHTYGKTDLTYDMINHRVSMNNVFTKALDGIDKSGFPKSENRFANMIKKIKPLPKTKR